ncbi:MAG: hypothetical protein JNM69_17120 [Archangium sp.]|nr:hypothetical protein [Archangium sp.]
MKRTLLAALLSTTAFAAEPGEEVELSSAPVTGLSCAKKAIETGKLDLLSSCPLSEAPKGIVVFDVAEMQYYQLDTKTIRTSALERAFAGGSVDVTGKVKAVDKKTGIATVQVSEYRVTPRPKPGAFKGCL